MRILCAALIILSVLAPGRAAFAQAVFVDEEGRSGKQVLSLPYAFSNETFGFAGAYVYGITGYPQPQSSLIAAAMVGTKGTGMLALIGQDIQMPGAERLFLDPIVSAGRAECVEQRHVPAAW